MFLTESRQVEIYCSVSNEHKTIKKLKYHIFKKKIKSFYCLQLVDS